MAPLYHLMPGSSITPYKGVMPRLGNHSFLASGAHLIGDLISGDECSFWFNVVVRADCNSVRIGNRTNVQDGTVIHVTHTTGPTLIGSDVTIGHNVTLHACTLEDLCLVGMGAVILDGAVIPTESFVAAGAVVTPGKRFPPRSMILGSPARAVRALSEDEVVSLKDSRDHYLEYARCYRG